MNKKKTSNWRIFGIITVSLAVIIFYGIAIALFGMTLVRPIWIIAVSILLAGVTAAVFFRKWRKLSGTSNVAVNVIIHVICSTGFFMAVILGLNYFCRDASDAVTVRAEIINTYTETRYRMKRVARNRYTRGEPYQVYFMDVCLPDGRQLKRSISLERYNRFVRSRYRQRKRPDSINLRLTSGALGMTVIERDSIR